MKKAASFLIRLFQQLLSRIVKIGKQCISWYVHTFRKLPWYGRTGMGILTGIGMLIVLLVMIDLNFLWLFGKSPSMFNIKEPIQHIASEIYSADGKLIGKFYSENRTPVEYKDISPILVKTLVCTEDERFYKHFGIDFEGVFAAAKDYVAHGTARGASTITQQLVKNLFKVRSQYSTGLLGHIPGVKLLIMKAKEWVTAVKIEMLYSKEEILTMYFNTVDFGSNAFGIKTACHTYFNTTPDKITVEQAATLIGLLKATTYYNPKINPKNSLSRRNVVLGKLYEHHVLNKHQLDSIRKLPTILKFKQENYYTGPALYFREAIANELKEWCKENNTDLYGDGLKIYTTLDSRMQQYAEEAVYEHVAKYLQPRFFKEKRGRKTAPYTNELTPEEVEQILNRSIRQSDRYRTMKADGCSEAEIMKAFNTKYEMSVFSWDGEKDTIMTPLDSIKYYKHFLRAGFMSMDPITGHVKAYVGGPNYNYFQYDMAMVGRRQVGSTIKPYLYALAMENGFSPCDEVRNVEQTLFDENGKAWSPRNSSKSHYGEIVTLKWGLANSNNWISAYLMSKLSPYDLVRLIHSFGVLNKDIQPTVSLCLGPCEISVGEMVSAYTAFVNKGIRTAPLFVTRIEDNDGNVVANFTPQVNEVISESTSYKMLVMLRAVINEGTGGRVRRLYGIKADMGGKTGTTNRNSDGWFMGFIPSLVSGCWVGGEERDIHFDTMRDGQGASMALPIWGLYMQKVYADKTLGYSPDETFDIPGDFDPCKDRLTEIEEENNTRLDDVFFQ